MGEGVDCTGEGVGERVCERWCVRGCEGVWERV